MLNTNVNNNELKNMVGDPDFIIGAMLKLKEANAQADILKNIVDEQMAVIEKIKARKKELQQIITDRDNTIQQKDFQIELRDIRIKQIKPMADYCEQILHCKNTLPITVIAKDYGISARKMNKILHEEKVQYKCGGVWVLYQKYADAGLISTNTRRRGDKAIIRTRWTQKGRQFIYDLMKKNGYLPVCEQAAA